MELVISNVKPETDKMIFWISTENILDKAIHLYVASNCWDKLSVEITDKLPTGVLDKVVTRCKEVEVMNLPLTLTQRTVELLCELYPEKSGKIRKTYLMGKEWQ